MSRASEVVFWAHGLAGAVRRQAQKACAGMTRNHKADRDVYMFTDGSRIVVARHKVYVEEPPLTRAQMDQLSRK